MLHMRELKNILWLTESLCMTSTFTASIKSYQLSFAKCAPLHWNLAFPPPYLLMTAVAVDAAPERVEEYTKADRVSLHCICVLSVSQELSHPPNTKQPEAKKPEAKLVKKKFPPNTKNQGKT